MNIELYERIWMWVAALIIGIFISVVGVSTYMYGVQPPSHVESIDPSRVFQDPRFAKLGEPIKLPDGTLEVRMVAAMFAFFPNEVHIPAGRPIRFRLTSMDVIHGFLVTGTNANAMIVPGYVTQFTMTFPEPGDHLLVCHEFCGNGHHVMFGRVIVEGAK